MEEPTLPDAPNSEEQLVGEAVAILQRLSGILTTMESHLADLDRMSRFVKGQIYAALTILIPSWQSVAVKRKNQTSMSEEKLKRNAEMLALRNQGATVQTIATQFGISTARVSQILRRMERISLLDKSGG
jgi:hypothetical protein